MKTDYQTIEKVKRSNWKTLFIALLIFTIALTVRYIGLKFAFPCLLIPTRELS